MTLIWPNLLIVLLTIIRHANAFINDTTFQILTSSLSTNEAYNGVWSEMTAALKSKQINEIAIINSIATKAGLEKLFSQNLTLIKKLRFENVILNEETIGFLLAQDRLYQFENLVLDNCNIFCHDFQNLQERQTKIKNLSLAKNVLSAEGFKYLSRLKMNLTSLELREVSLIDDQAVDSIISMGLSKLVVLDLCASSISAHNMLRVLNQLNLTNLRTLKMCSNNFPLSFYEQFSKFNFSGLEHLNIMDMNIDEDGFQILMKMSFPQLLTISMQENQLTSKMGCLFLTKKRFPKVHSISLDKNFINTTLLQCLKKQQFVLRKLSCMVKKMNLDGLTYISELNTSNLTEIWYESYSTTVEVMKNFILNTDFRSLKILHIEEIKNAGSYFQHILSRKWQNLNYLYVTNVQKIDEKVYYAKQPIFPELQKMYIKFSTTDQPTIFKFVKNIQRIAPKLKILKVVGALLSGPLNAIVNGTLTNSLTVRIYLQLEYLFPHFDLFRLVLDPNEKVRVLEINLRPIFLNVLFSKGQQFLNNPSSIQDFANLLDIMGQINTFQNNLHSHFDFTNLETLVETGMLNFMRNLLSSNFGSFTFRNLISLTLEVGDETNLSYIQSCQFPAIQVLVLTKQGEDITNASLTDLHGKFDSLTNFLTDLHIRKQEFISFFKNHNLVNLNHLNFIKIRNVKPEDLEQIISYIPYFNRIRGMMFDEVFINNNLSFLVNSKLKPNELVFENILFNQGVLQQLCQVEYQFITKLVFIEVGFDDRSIIDLMDCIQNKKYYNQTRDVQFPKLLMLSFHTNYVGSLGTSRLMSMKMPMLKQILLDENTDSEIFNSVFRSPWSKRIKQFVSQQKKITSIDKNMDPKNTRKLEKLVLTSSQLQDIDIEALSNLQFFSLQSLRLDIKRIESCQSFKYLLKLTKNVMEIQISILDSPQTSSSCLNNRDKDDSWISPESLVLYANQYYGQASKFVVGLVGRSSEWKSLGIINIRIEPEIAATLFETANFKQITLISLVSCDIGDDFLKEIAGQNLNQVLKINLGNNPISSDGLKYLLSNREFSKLETLTLSGTRIGDKGIEYLKQHKFSNLANLNLANVDLTRQGIMLLNELEAPKLISLDLSNNGLSFQDLLLIDTKRWNLFELKIYPQLTRKQVEVLSHELNNKNLAPFFSGESTIVIRTQVVEESQIDADDIQFYETSLSDSQNQSIL